MARRPVQVAHPNAACLTLPATLPLFSRRVRGCLPASMRFPRWVACAALVAASASTALAQVPKPGAPPPARRGGAPPSAVAREIANIEERIDSALARHDTAALAPLVADSFRFVHAMDGRVDSRATWLADAARGMALSRQRNALLTFDTTLTVYGGQTAVRTSRVRLRITAVPRESWVQQMRVYVREPAGWRLAYGQGTRMYDGPVIDTALYRRYAGTYVIDPARSLVLEWDGYALMARWPNGSRAQTFLASPTDELVASRDLARLHFTLGADGRPTAVSSVRDTTVLWRAERVDAGHRDARPPSGGLAFGHMTSFRGAQERKDRGSASTRLLCTRAIALDSTCRDPARRQRRTPDPAARRAPAGQAAQGARGYLRRLT